MRVRGAAELSTDRGGLGTSDAPVALPRLRAIGYASFGLIGWAGLLVPSLIRSIEHDFGRTDADLGIFYFVYALFYAIGGGAGGGLGERFGRGVTLPLAGVLLGLGFAGLALAPVWPVFVLLAMPAAIGGGAIDSGVNGLFLELHPGEGNALNLLHLFFSIGALLAPLVVGALVDAGVPWQMVILGTVVVAFGASAILARTPMPSGRHHRAHETEGPRRIERFVSFPILLLGVGIGTYVAAEVGVSSWLVRFFDAAPLAVATGSLSLFWGGLALGRLIGSRVADRFPPIPFVTVCALVAGGAIVAAVAVPSQPLSIALFGVSGFAQGPIYPMIMAIGGSLRPGRSSAVSGVLTVAAVIGGLVYPPLIGFISVSMGIGAGLLGAGAMAFACAVALAGASVLRTREAAREAL